MAAQMGAIIEVSRLTRPTASVAHRRRQLRVAEAGRSGSWDRTAPARRRRSDAAGLLRPTSGQATIFGLDVWSKAAEIHHRMAYLGSDPGYLPEMSSAAQLDYLAHLRGLPGGAWRGLAERLELDPSIPTRKLSRGNRQKIGVVAAFMGHEPLMVMDEPTTGLDPLMQREFLSLVAEARAEGRTVFLSSHNLQEVERACERVAIIREGHLVEIATVADLLGEHWRSVNLVLAEPPPEGTFDLPNVQVVAATGREVHVMVQGDVNPLLARIAGVEVHDIGITTPDVEDLFLRYYHDAEAEPAEAPPEEATR
jgi:ABC-2 type transport system ATP-binding protein